MLVNRIWFFSITVLLMLLLYFLTGEPVLAGIITFIIAVAGYLVIAVMRSTRRLSLLEDKCDPQAFLEATEKQMQITGKNPKTNAYLNIDKAAAMIEMGDYQNAKALLLSLDKSVLSVKNGSQFAYTVNLMFCHYELGETAAAEQLFETQIPLLAPVNPRMKQAMEFLIAQRYLYLNKFEESKERYLQLQQEKLSRRKQLELSFGLAQIEEVYGDYKTAEQKYREAADQDSKLWVSIRAREWLKNR